VNGSGGKEQTGGPLGVPGRTARGERRRGDFETVLGRVWLWGTSLGKARGGSDAEAGRAGARGATSRSGAEKLSVCPCLN
jgi:hypothetical protein